MHRGSASRCNGGGPNSRHGGRSCNGGDSIAPARCPCIQSTFEFAASHTVSRTDQRLVADPSNTGVVVVEIEDKLPGAAPYSFTLTWEGHSEPASESAASNADAVEACQRKILTKGADRFKTGDIYFRRTSLEDDQIRGTIDVNTKNQPYRFRFHCTADAAQIDETPAEQDFRDYAYGGNGLDAQPRDSRL